MVISQYHVDLTGAIISNGKQFLDVDRKRNEWKIKHPKKRSVMSHQKRDRHTESCILVIL